MLLGIERIVAKFWIYTNDGHCEHIFAKFAKTCKTHKNSCRKQTL